MKRDRQTKAAADVFPVSSVREILAPLTSQTASEVPVTHAFYQTTRQRQSNSLTIRNLSDSAVRVEQARRTKPAKAVTEDKPDSASLSVERP
jgi:purine-nucleoside phosphorylase